ncbi:hypothetical protein EW145_g5404 [Phellinidium pouzarii]|uniref:Xylanolytic transcriptional activator regulatory domain-containing protein n=1 Tax=Phellinidium pouzarii TaxID=167371 RepID=A0A4S4L083_9AGAM|nr:hypothetical protein EW145_g5404 [Phellinidium pouzarii]
MPMLSEMLHSEAWFYSFKLIAASGCLRLYFQLNCGRDLARRNIFRALMHSNLRLKIGQEIFFRICALQSSPQRSVPGCVSKIVALNQCTVSDGQSRNNLRVIRGPENESKPIVYHKFLNVEVVCFVINMSSRGHDEGKPTKPGPLKKGQACVASRCHSAFYRRFVDSYDSLFFHIPLFFQKCDGTRPICLKCSTNGRELDCEYSDGYLPTRTEMLQEYLVRLQNRVDTLESARSQRRQAIGNLMTQYDAPLRQSNTSFSLARPSTRWWEAEIPPVTISRILIDGFLQHAYQVGWALDNNRVLVKLSSTPSDEVYPHFGLVNAMYLWGVHFSFTLGGNTPVVPQIQTEIEQAIFARACAYLQTNQIEGQDPQRGLQAIQAEVLLATYLFSMGSGAGGTYTRNGISHKRSTNAQIAAPPLDAIEEGERIAVFWRVFCLDRQWAIARGRPSSLRLDGDAKVVILTPWPVAPESYEQGYSESRVSQPLKQFLEEQRNSTSGFSYPALSVKACFLCEHASYHATLPSSDSDNRATDATIFAFVTSLAALDSTAPTALKARFVGIHATAFLSFVRLHERNAPMDPGAYVRCVQAARYISTLLRNLDEEGIAELDPFVMPCFVTSCKVLMREISRTMQMQGPQQEQGGIIDYTIPGVLIEELERVMSILSVLAPVYPVLVSQLDSLREMRTNMQI